MKLTSKPLAAIIFVILFGGIAFSTWMGWWQTETTRIPAKYTQGEQAGQYNPADIRGSYTFGDVSRLFEIPLSDLQIAFRLPGDSDPAAVALKDLEALYAGLSVEIGTASVRMFAAYYKGLPIEVTEETYLFPEAVNLLKQQGQLTDEQLQYLALHTVQDAEAPQAVPAAVETPAVTATPGAQETASTTQHAPEDRKMSGKTTLKNLWDWGLSKETLENILGSPLPPEQTIVKDYCAQKGLTFSEIKSQLQTEIDLLP